jgi:hypothetical protein
VVSKMMDTTKATFWNERYTDSEYAYGTTPNHFLGEELGEIEPGKILFPCEGEGRINKLI